MTKLHIALGEKVPAGIAVDLDHMFGDESDRSMFQVAYDNSAALRYIVDYGWKQSLNDCISAVKTSANDYTVEKTLALVEKKMAAIMAGTVRQAGVGRTVSDPITAEARKLARAAFMAKGDQIRKNAMTAFRKAGVTGKDAEIVAAIVTKMVADNPAFMTEAAQIIASRESAIADLADINLDDLFAESEEQTLNAE